MATPSISIEGRTFKQTYSIRVLLAVILLGPAALAASIAFENQQVDKNSLYVAAGLTTIFVVLWILIGRTVLTIDAMGLKRQSAFGSKEIFWNQITETRYVVNPINVAGHFGLIGLLISAASRTKQANLTFRVIGSTGTQIRITSNFKDAREAIGLVLTRILPGMVSDARLRIERGETVQFGQVRLSKAGVIWKSKNPVPLTEIKSAELVGSKLRVKCTGKWLDAIAVRSDKIPNVLVLLEVLDSLAPQLRVAAIDPLARVRM